MCAVAVAAGWVGPAWRARRAGRHPALWLVCQPRAGPGCHWLRGSVSAGAVGGGPGRRRLGHSAAAARRAALVRVARLAAAGFAAAVWLCHAGLMACLVSAGGAMTALDLIRSGTAEACRPWPRFSLTMESWSAMIAALAQDPGASLLGLWADTQQVHALLGDGAGALVASVAVEGGGYPALSPVRPVASRLER